MNRSEPIDPHHGLCTGGYIAAVFSGHRDVLGEVAGEPTSRLAFKFVLADPKLSVEQDFASTSGATLRSWPEDDLRPINGVCFVFTNQAHPAVAQLRQRGAVENEHFLVTSGLAHDEEGRALRTHIAAFIQSLGANACIAVLGYGQQGRRIVGFLRDEFDVSIERLRVCDSNAECRRTAARDGLTLMDESEVVGQVQAVIGSPLAPYSRIQRLLRSAHAHGLATFDNAHRPSGRSHWVRRIGNVQMDEAASRALSTLDGRPPGADSPMPVLRLGDIDPALRDLVATNIIRIDRRLLANVEMPHLQSGLMQPLTDKGVDLGKPWFGDGLADETFRGIVRAFASFSPRASHGFFAARELCRDIWPRATERCFPSRHELDLGATAFERLLKNHLDARETVATMQTPSQRVTLGIVAAHYAMHRPVIEIGSALGGSMLHMAAATHSHADSSPLISVDPDSATRDIMRFVMQREGFGERLQQIVKTSDAAIADVHHLRGQCGLVFIDGLHTSAGVHNDFLSYAPLVACGGALAFHDVCPAIHSVMQTIVEHVLPDEHFQPRCLVDGLLVLERVRA